MCSLCNAIRLQTVEYSIISLEFFRVVVCILLHNCFKSVAIKAFGYFPNCSLSPNKVFKEGRNQRMFKHSSEE